MKKFLSLSDLACLFNVYVWKMLFSYFHAPENCMVF